MDKKPNTKPEGKPVVVSKPFLTGDPYDKTTLQTALFFFGSLLVIAVVYLIVCAVMTFDNLPLRVLLNAMVVFVTWAIYYSSGMSQGSIAVNNGEIMHHRRETGAEISKEELSRCYHPMKGYVCSLLGTLPLFLCAVILALIATRQTTGLGALPSWISALEAREEIGAPLAFYHESVPLGLEGVLRILIRLSLMPFVNMVGAGNPDGLLMLERFSPLLVFGPAVSYGFGYTRGVNVRARIHSDIARNTRKRAKKNAKAKARKAAPKKGPIELN